MAAVGNDWRMGDCGCRHSGGDPDGVCKVGLRGGLMENIAEGVLVTFACFMFLASTGILK